MRLRPFNERGLGDLIGIIVLLVVVVLMVIGTPLTPIMVLGLFAALALALLLT